jgi:penicillin-binding protein 1A
MNFNKKSVIQKHKDLVSTPKKLSTKFFVNIFKVFIFLLILVSATCASLGFGVIKGILDGSPKVTDLTIAPVGYSTRIYDSEGAEIEKLTTSGSNRTPVSIDQIPKSLQFAFIDIEDERFLEHNGIDVKGIFRAGYLVLSSGSLSQGASTITQQLLKNNVFENGGMETSNGALIRRKIQEQFLALEVEKVMSKSIILENYLNSINLGAGAYGVQAASRRYFNKDVSELNISESAVIAAITQNPTKYNPINNPEQNSKRRAIVLEKMLSKEHITQIEYQEAIKDDVYSRIQVLSTETFDQTPTSYFVDEIIDQVVKDLQSEKGYTYTQAMNAIYSGGLNIYSTQDSSMQKICNEELSNSANYPAKTYYSFDWRWSVKHSDGTIENYSNVNLIYYYKTLLQNNDFKVIFKTKEEAAKCIEDYKKTLVKEGDTSLGESTLYTLQPQASFSIIDQRTGYVKALVGGRGEKETSRSLNRATNTTRQPGSCFKILAAFGPAIDLGQSLATVYDDAPFNYVNGRPVKNWWNGYRGLLPIRYGIEQSANIVAVKTITSITPQVAFDYLLDFGFTTLVDNKTLEDGTVLTDITQATALGGITNGVTNLELCDAYATIANKGVYTEPVFYTKVTDYDGRVILENEPETKTVLKETTAWLLTNAMHGVITSGTGTSANVANQYIAGKTGTTSNSYDLWFAGYSDYLTGAIWTGFDENVDIGAYVSNESFHKTIWSKIMTRIHTEKAYPNREPKQPDDIVKVAICSKSGYLAVPGVCDHDPEGNMIKEEYFDKDNVPTETCPAHVQYTICNESGKLANSKCPLETTSTKIYRVRFLGKDGITPDSVYEAPAGLSESSCILHN